MNWVKMKLEREERKGEKSRRMEDEVEVHKSRYSAGSHSQRGKRTIGTLAEQP